MSGRAGGSRHSRFEYDAVFGPNHTQDDIYAEAAPVITSVLDGYHVCMFAYGASCSIGSLHAVITFWSSKPCHVWHCKQAAGAGRCSKQAGCPWQQTKTDRGAGVKIGRAHV